MSSMKQARLESQKDHEFQKNEWTLVSENGLVESAKAGTHAAFEELCRRHSGAIFRTILRITRHQEDAEDALQDSVLRAFLHLKNFDGRSSFSTWFTRIGINSALMVLRKKRTCREVGVEDSKWMTYPTLRKSSDPEYLCFEKEKRDVVRDAVRVLPRRLRGVIEVHYYQELRVKEVGRVMDISEAATKSRLLRAKRELSKALSDSMTAVR
jgi:RNA polymerase sigma-70 factor, ECF subfamily